MMKWTRSTVKLFLNLEKPKSQTMNEMHEEIDQDASTQTKSVLSAGEDSAQLDDDVVTQVGGNWKVTQIHGN